MAGQGLKLLSPPSGFFGLVYVHQSSALCARCIYTVSILLGFLALHVSLQCAPYYVGDGFAALCGFLLCGVVEVVRDSERP